MYVTLGFLWAYHSTNSIWCHFLSMPGRPSRFRPWIYAFCRFYLKTWIFEKACSKRFPCTRVCRSNTCSREVGTVPTGRTFSLGNFLFGSCLVDGRPNLNKNLHVHLLCSHRNFKSPLENPCHGHPSFQFRIPFSIVFPSCFRLLTWSAVFQYGFQ